MSRRKKNADLVARQQAISEYVMSEGTVRIDDLLGRFDVSLMTIHRDIDALAARGILRKARGTVTALSSSLVEASTEYRARVMQTQKQAVAMAALAMVEPGMSIILDDSTTGLYLADELATKCPLTVITNFQPAIDRLSDVPDMTLISLGGQYFPWNSAYMGSLTIRALHNLRADILFMSAPAIDADMTYHQRHESVLVKEASFAAAQTRVLFADHTKLAARALHAMIPTKDFDTVIIDDGATSEELDRLSQGGATVQVAHVEAAHPERA